MSLTLEQIQTIIDNSKKISALPSADPLHLLNIIEIVQGGINKKASVLQIKDAIGSYYQLLSQKNGSNGYPGLDGYKLVLRALTGNFPSYLYHNNTAQRSYLLPDKSGVITLLSDLTGANISVDNSSWEVLTQAVLQSVLDEIDTALLKARGTGVSSGGIVTADGGIGTGVDISITSGRGGILNLADPDNPDYTAIEWDDEVALTITTSGVTYLYIDSAGDFQQGVVAPTREDYRTRVYLARIVVNGGVITAISNISTPLSNINPGLGDLAEGLGPIRITGSIPQASGANLFLKISAGRFWDFGVTRWSNHNLPSTPLPPVFDSGVASTFRYFTTAGTINIDRTEVRVANYQDGSGAETAILANKWGVHFCFGLPSGNTRLSYGLEYFNSLAEAEEYVNKNNHYDTTPAGLTYQNSFCLGAIIAKQNATDLTDDTESKFMSTNRFGLFSGGTGTASSGSGDVVGPAGATDGAIVLYDGVTGKLIKDSAKVLSTVGGNIAALANPSAITFLRLNADNTVTARTDSQFLDDIYAGYTSDSTPLDTDEIFSRDTVSNLNLRTTLLNLWDNYLKAKADVLYSFWKNPPTVTRVSDTQFTIPDVGNSGNWNKILGALTVLKWTQSGTKMAMVTDASYSSDVVTVNIAGDTLSTGFSAFKYTLEKARTDKLLMVAGTIGTGTDLFRTDFMLSSVKLFALRAFHKSAGVTGSTTYDINKGGASVLPSVLSISSGSTDSGWYRTSDGTTWSAGDIMTGDCDSVSTGTAPVDAYIYGAWIPLNVQYYT